MLALVKRDFFHAATNRIGETSVDEIFSRKLTQEMLVKEILEVLE